jgi:hypothetical protein
VDLRATGIVELHAAEKDDHVFAGLNGIDTRGIPESDNVPWNGGRLKLWADPDCGTNAARADNGQQHEHSEKRAHGCLPP